MYKKEFIELLKNNNIPKSLLIYGNCDFQRDFYLKKYLSHIGESEKITFYFDEYNFKTALTHISQSSLFGNITILIIKNSKKIAQEELKQLIEVCFKNQNSYFVLEFNGEDAKAKEIEKLFSKKFNSNFVRFFKLNFYEAKEYIEKYAKEINLEIDSYAINLLFYTFNENLALCINELNKLSLLNKTITYKEVNSLSFALGEISLEDFIYKIIAKEDIKSHLDNILEFNDEVKIINSIQNYITTLFMFHSYIKINGGHFDSKEILGYNFPTQLANKMIKEAINIDLKKYHTTLTFLSKVELKLKKSTKIDKNSLLLSSLIKLQTLL